MVGSLSTSFGRETVLCSTCGKSTRDPVLDRPQRCDCSYSTEVRRTANMSASSFREQLELGAMGLAGEAGEVVDLLKKHLFHGKDLDRAALVKELGDVRWYLEYLIQAIGTTIYEVENVNVLKLRARYPNGFNTKDANNRKDEA